MKRGEKTPDQIVVEYKGQEWKLPPGHKVFEMNIGTGIVREHKIKKKFTLFFWRKPKYEVSYAENIIHLVAFDIHKAVVKFKHLTKKLNVRVKYEPKKSTKRVEKAGS